MPHDPTFDKQKGFLTENLQRGVIGARNNEYSSKTNAPINDSLAYADKSVRPTTMDVNRESKRDFIQSNPQYSDSMPVVDVEPPPNSRAQVNALTNDETLAANAKNPRRDKRHL